MKTIYLSLIMLISISVQAQDNTDTGYWHDIQLTKSVNKTTEAIGGVRFDTKRNGSRFSEQRIYAGLNLKQGRFTAQPMVVYLKNFAKIPFTEIRPQLTLSYRATVGSVDITPGVRFEYHDKQRLKDDGRIVPTLAFTKKLNKDWGVFNRNEFWIPIANDKDATKHRKRFFFGVSRRLTKNVTVEPFYLYQRDEQVAPRNTHKAGITWKIR